MPFDTNHNTLSNTGEYIEGGDILISEKTICLGSSPHRYHATNRKGISWFRERLPGLDFIIIDIGPGFHHLDMAVSIVNRRTILCSEDVVIRESPYLDAEIIKIPAKEARSGVINGLSISEDCYITPNLNGKSSSKIVTELESRGIEVIEIDYAHHLMLMGGIRCSTAPILRG